MQSLHECLCLADDVGGRMRWSSPQGEKTIETTGVWLFGGLTVLFALGKVMGLWGWSWGRVALPMLIFVVFNALYIATGFLYLSVFPVPERSAADTYGHGTLLGRVGFVCRLCVQCGEPVGAGRDVDGMVALFWPG